jgi:hypothetical protein
VRFDDGEEILADAGHRWLTFTAREMASLSRQTAEWRAARRTRRPSRATGARGEKFTKSLQARNAANPPPTKEPSRGGIRTTAEIASTLIFRDGAASNHAIPVTAPLDLPERHLRLDPYLLGVWLGDGTTLAASVTTMDESIERAFVDAGFPLGFKTEGGNGRAWTRGFLGLSSLLRAMDLRGHKHVPTAYLRASTAQRLALLQGLMDTDGTVCDSGAVEFTNTNREIAEAVRELVVSMGWKGRLIESRATLYGRDCGPKWDIKWTPSQVVFRLPRKALKQKLATRRTTKFRYIVGCDETAPVPMRCITVANPSGLFLAGPGMVPTHNSDALLGIAATRHRKSIIFRREFGQAKDLIERGQIIAGRYGTYNGQTYALRIKRPGEPNRNIEFAGCQYEDDKEKYRGRAHDFKGFDEVTDFTYSQYKFLTAWLRTIVPDQRCRVIATCNPPSTPEGRWIIDYWAPWLDPKHSRPAKPGELRWFAAIGGKDIEVADGRPIHTPLETIFPTSRTFIPARLDDNPDLVRTGYRRSLQNLPEPLRSQMLFGDFSAGLEDDAFQVVPTAWALEAMNRWRKTSKPSIIQTSIGVDVARGGRDKTVLAPRHAWWFDELIVFPGSETKDGSTVSAAVLPLHSKGGYVAIDADGVGASPYDSLVEAGADVMPVRFSEGAPDHASDRSGLLRFGNLRAYCYWKLREALDPDKEKNPDPIALPDDRELLADITAPRYRQRAGRLFIEEKDEIKKRIGRSPDKGDAVAVTFAASEDSGSVETLTTKYAAAEYAC